MNSFGDHTIRIAVKDAATTQQMLHIMREEMNHLSQL
jgi:hypothetical protein